ncbi:MAG: right-handed parallel beta-helix repeat-containing protein [Eubacteriales bacterium]
MSKLRILVAFTLIMTNILFPVPVFADILTKDDWTVTGDEVVVEKAISLTGNLTIKSGASLTLKDTSLEMNSMSGKPQLISVEPGGSLCIENCKITAADFQHTFAINVNNGSFELKDSELKGLKIQGGLWSGWYGIEIRNTNNIKITGNTIHLEVNVVGIQMLQSQKAVIENNTFISETPANNIAVDFLGSDESSISNNTFYGPQGIVRLSESWNNHVTNNKAEVTGGGLGIAIDWGSGNNIVENNNITAQYQGVCSGIRIMETTQPNLISHNTIKGFRVGILMSYTSNASIIGNQFSEIWQREAIELYRSYNNLILNNHVNSSNSGITLLESSGNTLQGNEIKGSSDWGIGLFYSSNKNTINGNTLENKLINIVTDNVNGNSFSDNNFIGSEHQAYDNTGKNNWNGNCWSGNDSKQLSAYPVVPNGIDNNPQSKRLPRFVAPVPQFKTAPKETNMRVEDKHIVDAKAWKDRTVTLQGNLIIDSGASLSLDNAVINTDEKYFRNKSLMISVEPGGTLSIKNSKIIGPEKDGSLSIRVSQGANVTITGSELRNLGDWEGKVGLTVMAENAVIDDNTFTGNYGAVSIQNANNWRVTGNKISEDFLGIYIAGQGGVVNRNEITQTIYRGIRLDADKQGSFITDNTLHDLWGIGMELHMQNSNVSNNTLYDIKGKAVATGQYSKKASANSVKDSWVASDAKEGNNWLMLLFLVGIGIPTVFFLILLKKIIRYIIRG